ncbi:hypothetical protein TeGR_g6281 [Tetraparma gracilis]|uniref:EGF-like domain-containing protein n=1 Tax=Tetraparma gracilis TaxID=2962635 RepID=A0ABQ6N5W7_9STRA|nr:hypothetical protein TeGR_g6281 [Tetraparma gracilis]
MALLLLLCLLTTGASAPNPFELSPPAFAPRAASGVALACSDASSAFLSARQLNPRGATCGEVGDEMGRGGGSCGEAAGRLYQGFSGREKSALLYFCQGTCGCSAAFNAPPDAAPVLPAPACADSPAWSACVPGGARRLLAPAAPEEPGGDCEDVDCGTIETWMGNPISERPSCWKADRMLQLQPGTVSSFCCDACTPPPLVPSISCTNDRGCGDCTDRTGEPSERYLCEEVQDWLAATAELDGGAFPNVASCSGFARNYDLPLQDLIAECPQSCSPACAGALPCCHPEEIPCSETHSCENRGVAVGASGFGCRCDCAGTGWGGDRCDEAKDCVQVGTPGGEWSHEIDCQNGGQATGTSGDCECDCDGTGFGGSWCEIAPQQCMLPPENTAPAGPAAPPSDLGDHVVDCLNGGRPEGRPGACYCDCDGVAFEGEFCELAAPVYCVLPPENTAPAGPAAPPSDLGDHVVDCLNGGRPEGRPGACYCDCSTAPGFIGVACEISTCRDQAGAVCEDVRAFLDINKAIPFSSTGLFQTCEDYPGGGVAEACKESCGGCGLVPNVWGLRPEQGGRGCVDSVEASWEFREELINCVDILYYVAHDPTERSCQGVEDMVGVGRGEIERSCPLSCELCVN